MTLSDFWEAQAEAWVRWVREPAHDIYWRFQRDRFLELVPPPGRLTVDVGCGEGRLARHLRTLGHVVLAIDSSPTMVRHAREADAELDVRQADATGLPVEDGTADLVVSFMSLMDVDDLPAAVAEAARVLAPHGGYCIAVTHPNTSAGGDSYFKETTKDVSVQRAGLEMTFRDTHRPLEAYFRALEQAGLLVERLREVGEGLGELGLGPRKAESPLFLHLCAVKPSRTAVRAGT